VKAPGHGGLLEDLVFGGHHPRSRDPLRIFETAHRALSSFGPSILVIDDLQWVDEQSLALVHYLQRAGDWTGPPLTVIAAARPSPAAAAFRASVETETPVERRILIDLGPLPLSHGVSLVQAIDRGLDEAAAADLWRQARGSPFWLEALAKARGREDPLSLTRDRLRALSSDAGELIAALAIVARPTAGDDVARVLRWEYARLHHAARELIARGLGLEEMGSLRLAHDLIREAATRSLSEDHRRRLHVAVADIIEAKAGDDLRMLSDALEHRIAAGDASPTLALRLLSSPQRRLLTADGLRLLASISDDLADAQEQVRLDQEIGELARLLGEQELAVDRWDRVAKRTLDPLLRQKAEIESARAAYRLGRSDDAHARLDRARAATPVDVETSIRIDALLAEIELWLDHRTADGSRTANRALAAARGLAVEVDGLDALSFGQRRAYLAALQVALDAAMQEDRLADVIELGDASMRVAQDLDQESYLTALIRVGFSLQPTRRIRERESRFREAWGLARRLSMPAAMVEAGHGLARSLRDLGRLQEAHDIAAQTIQLEGRLRDAPRRWGNAPGILHSIELSLGDPAAALRALRADAAAELDPHYRVRIHQMIAEWQARVGGSRLAGEVETELDRARAAAARAGCPRCSAELSIISADLLARVGRVEDARTELMRWEGRLIPAGEPMREVWQARARSAIAMAGSDVASAISTLESLIETLEHAALLEELLWARLDLGRALARIDRPRSIDAFTRAAELADMTGATTQGRMARQALRSLGVRAWRRSRATQGDALGSLSSRESEVVRLVAEGRSNREIAEILLLSPKTIERHLTNVLAKLGLRNRTELTALVHSDRYGILPMNEGTWSG
jgi:DNA-binding CsgD family transcriptional regulator